MCAVTLLVIFAVVAVLAVVVVALVYTSNETFTSLPPSITPAAPLQDYAEVKRQMVDFFNAQPEIAPSAVRLAFHVSATYDAATRTGGSNGATIRFSPEKTDVNNKGLENVMVFFDPIKTLKPEMSYGDLYTLVGVVAVRHMGGPDVVWKPGRVDKTAGPGMPNGLLPDADKGSVTATSVHIRGVFARMGFTPREMAALTGAHCVGKANGKNSKFTGKWVDDNLKFSNMFFKNLVELTWRQKSKTSGPAPFEAPNKPGIIMLPSDIALINTGGDTEMRTAVHQYAADQDLFFREFAVAYAKLLALGCPS